MPSQLLNGIGKSGVTAASSRDSAGDEELVAVAKRGDEGEFETLVKRHRQTIFLPALRYTRVREDAEDIVQQAFQKAFVHLQKFEGRPGMRRAIELQELGELSIRETARYMGLSVAAVKARVFHARKKIGKALRCHMRSRRMPGSCLSVVASDAGRVSQDRLACAWN
jgi:DNA-directed RNA polymerase specialized sigma24 family protein